MYPYTTFGVVAGIILFSSLHLSCTQKQEPKWPIDIILQDELYTYITVDSIPKPLIDVFATSDGVIPMVDPGEHYNSTDVIEYLDRPFKRLIFAGQSGNHWFIYFEQGGMGWNCQLHLFEYTEEKVELLIQMNMVYKATGFEELKRMIVKSGSMVIFR